ncbi:MAG: hypothetical protein AAF467_14395 [Actinomycetota bacterium]
MVRSILLRRVSPGARSERGVSGAEMALLLAVVALGAVGGLTVVGGSLGGGSDLDTASAALGEEAVLIDENTADGASAGSGAGGSSGVFGGAAEGVSGTGLDGGFTSDPEVGGYWNTHRPGEFIGEWEVVAGSVDAKVTHSASFGLGDEDDQFMDLNGSNAAGHIRRTVDVFPDTEYNLSVDLGENTYGGPAVKSMEIIWNGEVISTLEVDLPSSNELKTFTVRLPPSSTGEAVLEFRSLHGGSYGVLIDNPTLTLVPR